MIHRNQSAEVVQIAGHNGDQVDAYVAQPGGDDPRGGVIVVHHMPGWDDWSLEVTRRLAHNGYNAICPNIHHRQGPGTPAEQSERVRDSGGQVDEIVLGDVRAAEGYLRDLPTSNGKVGIIGFCSGGRVVYMAACSIPTLDAAVDCWGGNVASPPAEPTPNQPVAPLTLTAGMNCPILGIFGNDDQNPAPEQVDRIEAELKANGKTYEFHRYDGAGHGFFCWERSNYRQEQAVDGWKQVFGFYGKYLA